jgi:hypothetical protein
MEAPRMKAKKSANGLSARANRCLLNGGIPIDKKAIVRALKSGKLRPFRWPPNYGSITHFEVCHWAGINPKDLSPPPSQSEVTPYPDNGLSYRANRCLRRSAIPATKKTVRQALRTGALSPGKNPSNYGPQTHAELCRWTEVDPDTLQDLAARSHPADQAQEALDQARRLFSEGKFAESLAKHLWFHEHALKVRPSFFGVRLSFALADWVKLGKEYAPALAALRRIRDEKTSRLAAGHNDRRLFHDVEAINRHLDDSAATVDLFKLIDATWSDFAGSIYDLAEESLVVAQEYALAKKHLGNPMSRFDAAKMHFENGMQYAATSRIPEASRHAHESIFADDIIRIIIVLDKTGDKDQARRIQSEALVVLDHPKIRDAINS